MQKLLGQPLALAWLAIPPLVVLALGILGMRKSKPAKATAWLTIGFALAGFVGGEAIGLASYFEALESSQWTAASFNMFAAPLIGAIWSIPAGALGWGLVAIVSVIRMRRSGEKPLQVELAAAVGFTVVGASLLVVLGVSHVSRQRQALRMEYASHAKLSADELRALVTEAMADSARSTEASALASREDCPEDLLRKLAAHNDTTRAGVAYNANTPLDLLEQFSQPTQAEMVRFTVASNKRLTLTLIEKLAADPSPEVRIAVVRRADVSRALVEMLAKDPVDRVSSNAARILKSQ